MKKTYTERLKDLRTDYEIKQDELAKKLGVSQKVYSNYEIGERKLPIEILIALASHYKTSTDYILGLTNEQKPYPRA